MAGEETLDGRAAGAQAAELEVDGIRVEGVTAEALADFEFLEAMAALSDPAATDAEQLRALASIAPIVFGAAQWRRVKAELRKRNGGRLPAEAATSFIFGVLKAARAKN